MFKFCKSLMVAFSDFSKISLYCGSFIPANLSVVRPCLLTPENGISYTVRQ